MIFKSCFLQNPKLDYHPPLSRTRPFSPFPFRCPCTFTSPLPPPQPKIKTANNLPSPLRSCAPRCCAENPNARPTLREVLDKVGAIQESGQKHDESRGGGAGAAPSAEPTQSVDLLQLFDPVHNANSSSSNKANGRNGGAATVEAPASTGGPPPPPYDTAIQELPIAATASTGSEPPPYLEAVAAVGQLVSLESGGSVRDSNNASPSSMVSPDTRVSAGGRTEELIELTPAYGDAGSASVAGGHGQQYHQQREHGAAAGAAVGAKAWWETPATVVPAAAAATQGVAAQRHPPMGGGLVRNDSISCTRSTSLSEYGVDLPGVLRAAMGGGVLSSNARLLCVCCAGLPPEMVNGEARGAGNATTLKGTVAAADAGTHQDAGHVSVLDLWHRGRTVRYPAAADRAAMSPNQSESVIAVHGGGSLHVFSIPRRCRLQELAVATELCMWR